jgi:hypothetical protein
VSVFLWSTVKQLRTWAMVTQLVHKQGILCSCVLGV